MGTRDPLCDHLRISSLALFIAVDARIKVESEAALESESDSKSESESESDLDWGLTFDSVRGFEFGAEEEVESESVDPESGRAADFKPDGESSESESEESESEPESVSESVPESDSESDSESESESEPVSEFDDEAESLGENAVAFLLKSEADFKPDPGVTVDPALVFSKGSCLPFSCCNVVFGCSSFLADSFSATANPFWGRDSEFGGCRVSESDSPATFSGSPFASLSLGSALVFKPLWSE